MGRKRTSRRDRCEDAANDVRGLASDLNEVADQMEECKTEEEFKELISEAHATLSSVSADEFQSLKDECENWMEGLSGTNLENSNKYQMLEAVIEVLDEVISSLEGIDMAAEFEFKEKESAAEQVREVASELEEAADNASNADFPGMYS